MKPWLYIDTIKGYLTIYIILNTEHAVRHVTGNERSLVRSSPQMWNTVVLDGGTCMYRKFGYLCGNIIYANYASSCEGV